MISIKKRFLFIHIPKTGGNSIQNVLKDYSEDAIQVVRKSEDGGLERFEVRNSKYKTHKHSTLSDYKSIMEPETFESLFKFAVIRNPWDRLISFYFSPHRGKVEWDRTAFLQFIPTIPRARYYIHKTIHPKGELPTNGKVLSEDIDFLIRFEYLDHDFSQVCKRLDIPHTPLIKRNRSPRTHYSAYYDDELKEAVRQRFAEEIHCGGYVFDSSNE